MIQHEQSSPHQQGSLTGGFEIGPFAIEGEGEPEEAAEVVEAGGIVFTMVDVQSRRRFALVG